MSKPQNSKVPTKDVSQSVEDNSLKRDYDVGYGCPPSHSRFKKAQSRPRRLTN
jgi:hypothetical protein